MGIDPATFWAVFLYSYAIAMPQLISSDKTKEMHFYSSKSFMDDLCAVNNGRELERYFCDIYPKELEFKIEHHDNHATLFNLSIMIKKSSFINKLIDKKDFFPFLIGRMPHIEGNILKNIFFVKQSKVDF